MAFTYFFRDLQTLEAAVEHLLPIASGRRVVRIWDAGCAMGQEPYSLAILLAERMSTFAFRNVRIEATDIDTSNRFSDIVGDGSYDSKELQRIPKPLHDRYFQSDTNSRRRVIQRIRSHVHYTRHDLLSLQPVASGFSLVMCKNVLLHVKECERVQILQMFHEALVPGGILATEQTQIPPQQTAHMFEQITSHVRLFRRVAM